MRKLLALTLSLLMVFTFIPMAMVTAETDPVEYKFNFYENCTNTSTGSAIDHFDQGGTDLGNLKYAFVGSVNVGDKFTFTTKTAVPAGVYNVTMRVRTNTSGRAKFNVYYNNDSSVSKILDPNIDYNIAYEMEMPTLKQTNEAKLTMNFDATVAGSMYILDVILKPVDEVAGTTTDALTLKTEASIRLNEQAGIRFYTAYDESKITGKVVEKGTLIGPSNLIGNYLTYEDTAVPDGADVGNAVAVKYDADTLWADDEFVGSIVGIKETNYTREFSARAYVKLDDGTYLYSATTTTKTVSDIADAYIANNSEAFNALDATTKELVQKWADANN